MTSGVPPSPPARFRPVPPIVAGIALTVTIAIALAEIVVVGRPSGVSVAAYLVCLPLIAPFLRRQQLIFVALCVAVAVLMLLEGKTAEFWRALGQSVGLAVLLASLVWLRIAARQSKALSEVSRGVAGMSRTFRHAGLALASHFIGILLNVGLFGLLAPLVAQAKAAPEDERDMALSVLRGFGFTMLWAPTAAAQVVITSVVPGVTWDQLAPRAFTMAMSLIALSWLYSRYVHRALPQRRAASAEPFKWRAIGELTALIVSMVVLIVVLHVIGGYSLTSVVTVAGLLIATIWSALQAFGAGAPVAASVARQFSSYVHRDLAIAVPEIVTLGAAGFLGIAASAVIPQPWIEAVVGPLSDHLLILYLVVTCLVPALSALGLNPLVAASLIGGSFAAIPAGHLEPDKLAFALATGWAVAYGISPFTTGAVVIGGTLGVRPEVLTWRWNGPFTLIALAYGATVVAAVALFL